MKNNIFEEIKKINEYQSEFWSSRDLAKVLDYSEYRHFLPVIKKAKEACENSGQVIHNHFEDISEMVEIGSGAKRAIEFRKWANKILKDYLIQGYTINKKQIAKNYEAFMQTVASIQNLLPQHVTLDPKLV